MMAETYLERESDRQSLALSSFFSVVFLIYFFGLPDAGGPSYVFYGWLIVAVVAIGFVSVSTWLPVLLFYLLLSIFYFYGAARSGLDKQSVELLKVVATSVVYSAIFCAVCGWNLRGHKNEEFVARRGWLVWYHRLFICCFLVWTFMSVHSLKAGDVIDFRLFVGESYLTLSDLFALYALSYLSRFSMGFLEFVAVSASAMFVLVFLGSRASMVLFVIVVSLLLFKRSSIRESLFGLFLVVLGAISIFQVLKDSQLGIFFRLESLLSLSEDDSRLYRAMLADNMYQTVGEQWSCIIIGCLPISGMYIHNILSVVQYFGVFGVAILLFFFLVGLASLKSIWLSWWVGLYVYALLALLFFRAWMYPVFPIFVAMTMVLSGRIFKGRYSGLVVNRG